jgi:hypothetical protein
MATTDPEAVYRAALEAGDHPTALRAVYMAGLADGAASATGGGHVSVDTLKEARAILDAEIAHEEAGGA